MHTHHEKGKRGSDRAVGTWSLALLFIVLSLSAFVGGCIGLTSAGKPNTNGPGSTPAVQIDPPAASNITANSATITWGTNVPANSQVDYGTTSAYGAQTALDSNMGTSHSQSVSSLKASQIYHYRVTSRDANNNVATSSDLTFTTASATPDTTPPTVSITSPANGATVSSALTVSANAADNVAVASVQFRVDGNNAGSPVTAAPYIFSLNTATLTNASHTLTAVAKDTSNNTTTSAAVTINVNNGTPDTTPPTVSITSPLNGATVSGALTVSANAADNVAVASVQFQVDGGNTGSPVTAAPYTFSLNTATLTNASHALTAVAKDTSNNTATSGAVNITVNNGAPDTTPPTVPTGLTATAVASYQINLSWIASTDNVGVTGYNVYRGGTKIGTSAVTSYQDVGLTPSTSYSYTVAAYDAAGNISAPSASASATTQPAPSGAGLAALAASMQRGTFAELTGMGGWNGGAILTTTFAGGSMTEYSDKMTWDTTTKEVHFIGGEHCGSGNCPGSSKLIKYADANNNWTVLPDSFTDGHTYQAEALNPSAGSSGRLYFRSYNSLSVHVFDAASKAWISDLPQIPIGSRECCGGLEYFPDRNSLIFVDGSWGVWEYSFASNAWACLGSTSASQCGPLHPMAAYPDFAIYDAANHRIWLGGGTNVYTLDSNGNLASRASAPFSIGVNPETTVTADPVTGNLIAFHPTNSRVFASDGNGWTDTGTVSPFPDPAINGGLACTPVSTYGVIMCVYHATGKVWLYKHAAGAGGGPVPPTLPTISGVTATSITSSSAIITWTTNVGASSQVNYGTTTSYGLNSGLNATLVTSHVAMLSGLTPSTLHHYQVVSTDSSANQATSGDFTFSTTSTGGQSTNGWANRIAGQNVPGGAASIVSSYNFDSPITLAPTATCATSPCTTYQRGAQSYFTYYKNQPNSLGTDCTIAADGCSMKITILNGYFQGEPGSFDYNFSPDLSRTFGPGQEFYVQYRERIDAGVLGNIPNAEGLKHDITTEGDTSTKQGPDCSNSPAEIVTIQDGVGANYPVLYANCGYSGGANAFMQSGYQLIQLAGAPGSNYLDQVTAGCPHYSGRGTPTSDPTCWNYVPNEWFTIQKHIKIGSWNSPTSVIEFWTSHQGRPAQLITNAADAAIPNDGTGGASGRYGKIQLSAYNTAAHWNVNTAVWFDDLIISTRRIPDPDTDTPNAPDNLSLTNIGANSVTVNWRVNSQNGTAQDDTGFLVERCVGNGAQCFPNPQSGFSQIGATAAGANSYVDNTVVSGTTYTYRVRARNATGMSGYAAAQCFNIGPTCGGKVVVP